MALNILPPCVHGLRLQPVETRHAPMFCFVLLTGSCALASFAFACATPLAAFAVVAAAMLPVRAALVVTAGAWLVNQTIGFGALHYPIDASTIAWGFVIGAGALAATLASAVALRCLPPNRTALMLALALVCAYASYELTLFAATPFLGGADAFTLAIVARLWVSSAVWLSGLVAICEITRMINSLHRRPAIS